MDKNVIDVNDKILRFERGLPGFPEEKEFILVSAGEDSPFFYLQSVKSKWLSFITAVPFAFFPDYDVELPEYVVKRLEITSPQDVGILVIITVREELVSTTANLVAPVVFNINNCKAEQVVLEGTRYTTRHPLFPESTTSAGGK